MLSPEMLPLMAQLSPWLIPSCLILVGFIVLVLGGEILVRGASGMALAFKIPPLIVGLTIVAFCTSAPEMAVSVNAAIAGQADLAVGNVVGSCICNILLVLGFSAVIMPLLVSGNVVRQEVPFLLLASFLTYFFAFYQPVTRVEGLILFGLLIVYMTWSVARARTERKEIQAELATAAGVDQLEQEARADGLRLLVIYVGMILVGLAALVFASNWLVKGGVEIAEMLGVSKLVIGLTIMAIGTSLPEIAVSVIAALRGNQNLAVGNVIGSNIFNLLGVLGLTAAVSPTGLAVTPEAISIDMPIMLGATLICLPIFISGLKISRWEGGILVLFYIAYLVSLFLVSTNQELGEQFRFYVFGIAGPAAIVICFIPAVRCLLRRRQS